MNIAARYIYVDLKKIPIVTIRDWYLLGKSRLPLIDSLKCYTALRHRVILIISECIISEVGLREALCI